MEVYDYSTICRHVEVETESTECRIKGSFPTWVRGFALYNGPAITKVGDAEYKHAFDSSALIQKFTIEHGHVYYKTKFLQSATFMRNMEANDIVTPGFGTPGPANKGVFSRVKDSFDFDKVVSDNALLKVVKMGTKYYALGETPFFHEIDPESLDTLKRVEMFKLYKLATQSVHIIQDEEGSYYTIGQSIGVSGPKYAIVRFPQDGDVEKGKTVAMLPCRWVANPCFIHAMGFSRNYCVLIETPLTVSIMDLLGDVLLNKPLIEGLQWKNEKTLFHIIDRRTWTPLTFRYFSDPFFFLHFANVFEQAGHLVLDLCAYPDAAVLQNMFIKNLRSGRERNCPEYHASFCPSLKRFVIPLEVGGLSGPEQQLVTLPGTRCTAYKTKNLVLLTSEVLCDIPFENPVTNPKFADGGRYVWGVCVSLERKNFNQIIKLDLKTSKTLIFKEEGLYPTPALFVAPPHAKDEDEGLLIVLCLTSGNEHLVTLLILDAATMAEICRATAVVKATVPLPLHGDFYATIG